MLIAGDNWRVAYGSVTTVTEIGDSDCVCVCASGSDDMQQ